MSSTATIFINPAAISCPSAWQFNNWESLTAEQRLSCIGTHEYKDLNPGYHTWLPAGKLKEQWDQKIRPSFENVCNCSENRKYIGTRFIFGATTAPVAMTLFMLNKEAVRAEATPHVVISNSDSRTAKKYAKLLRQHESIPSYGFQFVAQKRKIVLVMFSLHQSSAPIADANMTGSPVQELYPHFLFDCLEEDPVGSAVTGRSTATVGGFIRIGEHIFGLTAAHVLFMTTPAPTDACSTSISGQNSHNSSDSCDSSSLSSYRGEDELVEDKAFNPFPDCSRLSLHSERLGEIGCSLQAPSVQFPTHSLTLDWALLPTKVTDLAAMLTRFPGIRKPPKLALSPSSCDVIVEGGFSGRISGAMLDFTSSLHFPWSDAFTTVWVLKCTTKPGDCGSWAYRMDLDAWKFLGMVVAYSAEGDLTYIVPAKDLLFDIADKLWLYLGTTIQLDSLLWDGTASSRNATNPMVDPLNAEEPGELFEKDTLPSIGTFWSPSSGPGDFNAAPFASGTTGLPDFATISSPTSYDQCLPKHETRRSSMLDSVPYYMSSEDVLDWAQPDLETANLFGFEEMVGEPLPSNVEPDTVTQSSGLDSDDAASFPSNLTTPVSLPKVGGVDTAKSTIDEKMGRRKYCQTTVSCENCRRLKMICKPGPGDASGQCQNCIQLKIVCSFFPMEDGHNSSPYQSARSGSAGSKTGKLPHANSTSIHETFGGLATPESSASVLSTDFAFLELDL